MYDTPQTVSAPADAGKVVDALKAAAEQEFQIAERLAAKARQAYALAAGVFVIAQTVAFGAFQAKHLDGARPAIIVVFAIIAVAGLGWATYKVLAADDVQPSGDLEPEALMDLVNDAYEHDENVLGKLAGAYSGVLTTRREANDVRRTAYKETRTAVGWSLIATGVELFVALLLRII